MAGKGRPKGSLNKATADVKKLAQKYTDDALKTLKEIMQDKKAPCAARVSASKELLDRAYGRPAQIVSDPDGDKLFPDEIKVRIVSASS
jgi:phage gp46-like protein